MLMELLETWGKNENFSPRLFPLLSLQNFDNASERLSDSTEEAL